MSFIYDGGGASNALQTDATAANVVASGADILDVTGGNYLRIWMGNTTASQGGTLLTSSFSTGDSTTIPTIAQQTMSREFTITGTDNTCTVDSEPFTGTAGATVYVKDPLLIYIGTANRVMLNMAASDGGVWYCRFELLNFNGGEGASITQEVGDVSIGNVGLLNTSEAEIDPATKGNQDTLVANLHVPIDQTALGTVAASTAWDVSTEVTITGSSHYLHVASDQDVYLVCDATTGDPSTDPAYYIGGMTHIVPCQGQTYLHVKAKSALGAVFVTAFHD